MDRASTTLLPWLGAIALAAGLVLLLWAWRSARARRADRIILDAFELGGRLSLDPVEVTGSALLRRRVEVLRASGLLAASERGMLVPDQVGLAASIARQTRRVRLLLALGLTLLAAGGVLAWPLLAF
jgi:hypothetical protein